jgi:hypothetical protein
MGRLIHKILFLSFTIVTPALTQARPCDAGLEPDQAARDVNAET